MCLQVDKPREIGSRTMLMPDDGSFKKELSGEEAERSSGRGIFPGPIS